MYVSMYVCMYVCIFRATQDGGARGLRFIRLAIIYVRISPSIYQSKFGHVCVCYVCVCTLILVRSLLKDSPVRYSSKYHEDRAMGIFIMAAL